MAVSRKSVWPKRSPAVTIPIRYLTENGFSIVRWSEVDASVRNTPDDCRFQVQHDDGPSHDVQVRFAEELITRLWLRRRRPLSRDSVFWLVCAESCLATYLWEQNDLPPQGSMLITDLSPEELMLALHWRDRD